MRLTTGIATILTLWLLAACGRQPRTEQGSGADTTDTTMTSKIDGGRNEGASLTVASDAFGSKGRIPAEFTCDGEDISPPLRWSGVQAGARSIAIICEDPDAPRGTWTHWVVWSLPAGASGELPRGAGGRGGTAHQGRNDFGNPGYGGPCPPGGTHRYIFRVYALDTVLKPSGEGSRKDLLSAMAGHILAEGELVGLYGR